MCGMVWTETTALEVKMSLVSSWVTGIRERMCHWVRYSPETITPVIPINKPYVDAVPLDNFESAWQTVVTGGLSKRMLLLVLHHYSYDNRICSLAGNTLLDRYLLTLSIHQLEMIFRTGDAATQTRAADSILHRARTKDDLGQLVVSPNIHQLTAARKTLAADPDLYDLCRCMEVPGVAEEAFALYQERIRARTVTREHASGMCHPARAFGARLKSWLEEEKLIRTLPLETSDAKWYNPLTWFGTSEIWRLRLGGDLSVYELARCMNHQRSSVANAAFAAYQQMIREGLVPPEHVLGMCHPSGRYSHRLRSWLEAEEIEYKLPQSVHLQIWAMMKSSSPQYARLYVH